MFSLLFFPVLIVLLMLQISIVSNLSLLHGTADIILLVMTAWGLKSKSQYYWVWSLAAGALVYFTSAAPFLIYMVSYLGVTLAASFLAKRVWQMPVLLMFFLTFVATFFQHFLTMVFLQLSGVNFSWNEALSQVTLPSALLNILLSLPVYILISDFVDFVQPAASES